MYRRFIKRILDIFGALVLFAIMLPVFCLIMVAQVLFSKGRVFFCQMRPGKNEQPFVLYKFKTMEDTVRGSEKERVTKIGKFLRASSLDEFPQLLNVIKGEMSLIGPRPLLMEYLPLYNEKQKRRHLVLPGITGWAQINGRNELSWEERFDLDLYYVDHYSFWLDTQIFFKSLGKVFLSSGIDTKSGQIMEKFTGSK